MDVNQLRRSAATVPEDPGRVRAGLTQGPRGNTRPDLPADRRTERLAAAEQALAEAYATIKAAGTDPDTVSTAFAVVRDLIAEAKECSTQARRELALAQYEREQIRRGRRHLVTTASPVILDMPGLALCPDPGNVQTPEEFMDVMRMFRIWAGKPSYRVMERQCARRFAASTIHTALQANDLPSLDMVQAILTACGAREEHRYAFASAWRRIALSQNVTKSAAATQRVPGLYPVSETA